MFQFRISRLVQLMKEWIHGFQRSDTLKTKLEISALNVCLNLQLYCLHSYMILCVGIILWPFSGSGNQALTPLGSKYFFWMSFSSRMTKFIGNFYSATLTFRRLTPSEKFKGYQNPSWWTRLIDDRVINFLWLISC